MQSRGIQVQDFDDVIIEKPLCQTINPIKGISHKNRETVLQMADMNFINEDFEKYMKSIKKKC